MRLHDRNLISAVLFAAAAATDWLDGYLARRLNQTSAFGAFLDPVADKLMVAAALLVLAELERVNAIVAFIIIGREIAISALREWMAKVGRAKSVAVNLLGKVKTTAQLIAIPLLLYHDRINAWFDAAYVGTWLIYLAAALDFGVDVLLHEACRTACVRSRGLIGPIGIGAVLAPGLGPR